MGNVSASSPLIRIRSGPGCLTPQVGSGDHPGQDAQPPLQLLSLAEGALRGRSPRAPRGGWPGFPVAGLPVAPGAPRLSVCSRLVSHILSLGVCDGAFVSGFGIAFRVISFTSYRFGLIWATGIVASATGQCDRSGRRKRPRMEGRTDAAPHGDSFFRPASRIIGGVQEFGFGNEAQKRAFSKLNQAEMRPEPVNSLLKGPGSAPVCKTGVGGQQENRAPRQEIAHFSL